MSRTLAVLLVLLALATRAGATAGTCSVAPGGLVVVAHIPGVDEHLVLSVDVGAGFSIPVDVDAASGRFTMMRADVPELVFDTDSGPVGLEMRGPDAVGTIDGSGTVSLPNFPSTFFVGGSPVPLQPTLSTGVQERTAAAKAYADEGSRLDFQTGMLTLVGPHLIPVAPIIASPAVATIQLTCQLAPVPSAADLPSAPHAKVSGKIVLGSDMDTLRLTANLSPGASAFDFSGGDLFVRLAAGGSDLVLVFVPAGSLHGKGKRLTAAGGDGGALSLLTVGDSPQQNTLGGAVTVVRHGKGATLKLRAEGVHLSGIGTTATASIVVGQVEATADVQVRGRGSKRSLR
jgi:hypothetical protein